MPYNQYNQYLNQIIWLQSHPLTPLYYIVQSCVLSHYSILDRKTEKDHCKKIGKQECNSTHTEDTYESTVCSKVRRSEGSRNKQWWMQWKSRFWVSKSRLEHFSNNVVVWRRTWQSDLSNKSQSTGRFGDHWLDFENCLALKIWSIYFAIREPRSGVSRLKVDLNLKTFKESNGIWQKFGLSENSSNLLAQQY